MKNFATQSGKSKGQFYTPAEVSRVIARTIGIANTKNDTPIVYDPTCGSGSLLLKVADETDKNVKLCGQEMDNATAALARMNMILHNHPISEIVRENTISTPLFKNGNQLKTFDFVVANPPFSFKSWSSGIDPAHDEFRRFQYFGIPPAKNGDYAFILHIIHSLKTSGKGACVAPHGVLFRGNAEAGIRTNIIRRGYIKGIIGLPTNLFYGTGIPACIIIFDKENAHNVDVFNRQLEIPKYSRMVSVVEIEKNDFNLNIPRYIDSQEAEDIQDIEAHLKGDIPTQDIEDLQKYWNVYPTLKNFLFAKSKRGGYSTLKIPQEEIKKTIFSHPEFTSYARTIKATFTAWKGKNSLLLKDLAIGLKPKEIIHKISEDILETFSKTYLIDKYDIYQHLMEYWIETMQDDMYLIAVNGWKAELAELEGKKGKMECDLVPKYLVINCYFESDKQVIEELQTKLDTASREIEEFIEENNGEEGYFAGFEKINKKNVASRIREIKNKPEDEVKKNIKEAEKSLDVKVISKYKKMTESEIKVLVVDDKWMATLEQVVKGEMDRISQRLTGRIKELAERYATPLPILTNETETLSRKVDEHIKKMGFNLN